MKKVKHFSLSFLCLVFALSMACSVRYAKETKAVQKEGLKVYKSDFVGDVAMPAVAVLHTATGSCTAFAFWRKGNIYRFATNAHCFVKEEFENGNIVTFFLLAELALYDKNGYSLGFYPAELIGASLIEGKEDFAIVETEIEVLEVPILKLSKNDPVFGHCAFTLGFPTSAVGRVFLGFVYRLVHKTDKRILLKVRGIRDGHGLSGAPIFDCLAKEVTAIIDSGFVKDPNLLRAFPISAFRKFQKEAEVKYLRYLEGW